MIGRGPQQINLTLSPADPQQYSSNMYEKLVADEAVRAKAWTTLESDSTDLAAPRIEDTRHRECAVLRSSELELHARAKVLFERESPGRLWRSPVGSAQGSAQDRSAANLVERQVFLSRVRTQMRAEGVELVTDEESPPQHGTGRA
jgi:hypothetical protein